MRDKLKKVLSIFLCIIMIFSLAACGGGNEGSGEAGGENDGGDVLKEENDKTISLIDKAWAASGERLTTKKELEHVGDKVKDISMELFRESVTEGENSMISPVSILMALSMAEMGAGGDSLKQMEKTFGCSSEDLSYWLKAWEDSLKTSKKTKMNIANSFWFRNDKKVDIKEEYLKNIAFYFDADAYKAPFNNDTVKKVNEWCDKNTYGMIKKIIENFTSEDVALIMNATAFEGVWAKAYEDFQVNEDETFYCENGETEKATMLYSTEDKYIEDEDATGFIKPYMDGYSFAAILPKEGVSVADYVKKLDGEKFRELMLSARNEEVHAVIPEFKSEYEVNDLVETLRKMGIKDIFNSAEADFSEMTSGDFFVSYIKHKSFIELDRKGTKAAAVTAIVMKCTSIMEEEIYEVRLDRPFIYAIIDDETQTPMFIGTTMSVESSK